MDTTVLHNCSVTPSWIRSISCKTWTLLGHCICTSISKTCALCISKAGALFVHVECTSLHGKLLGTAMSTAVPAVEQHAWGLGHAPRIIRPPTSQKGSMKVHAPTSLYQAMKLTTYCIALINLVSLYSTHAIIRYKSTMCMSSQLLSHPVPETNTSFDSWETI